MAKSKVEAAAPLNKSKLVRDTIEQLGDVTPKTIQAHILKEHGVEISTTMISSYKSNFLKKSNGLEGGDLTVGVRDLAMVRELIDRVGAAHLQALIRVLSK